MVGGATAMSEKITAREAIGALNKLADEKRPEFTPDKIDEYVVNKESHNENYSILAKYIMGSMERIKELETELFERFKCKVDSGKGTAKYIRKLEKALAIYANKDNYWVYEADHEMRTIELQNDLDVQEPWSMAQKTLENK